MRKFVMEGIVNHPNLGINFVTCFVRPRVASCHSICLQINIYHLEKSVSYPMIPNMRGSVTDYANYKMFMQEGVSGRLIGPGRSQG